MALNRRDFLRRLGFGTVAAAAAASGVLDIERLLWVPGEKTIFVPPPVAPLSQTFTMGDVFTIDGVYVVNPSTLNPTGILQQFVVTSDVAAGKNLRIETVYPQMIVTGPYQNVTAAPTHNGMIDGTLVNPLWVGKTIGTYS